MSETPLHEAAKQGNVAEIERLVPPLAPGSNRLRGVFMIGLASLPYLLSEL